MSKYRTPHFLILIFLAVTWGSSFILMKRGLFDTENNPVFSPNQVAAMRLCFAALALLPVAISALKKISWRDFRWIALAVTVGSGIPAYLFTNSMRDPLKMESSIAGILNSLTPVFTLLVGLIIFRKSAKPVQVTGVLIGLVGAASLASLNGFDNMEHWSYFLLIVVATICYGFSVNIVGYKLAHINAIHISAIGLLIVALPSAFIVFGTNTVEVLNTIPYAWKSLGCIAILGAFGTALATALYFWLAQKTTVLLASSVTYLIPIVAVIWGIGDGEKLGVWHLLCGLLILVGVWLVTIGRDKNRKLT